jgi:hypothetical protein
VRAICRWNRSALSTELQGFTIRNRDAGVRRQQVLRTCNGSVANSMCRLIPAVFTCKSQEPLCFPHGLLLPVLISRLEVTQSASEFESVTSGVDVPDLQGSVLAGVAVMEFGGGVLLLGSHHHSHDPSIHTTPFFT